jgi:tetratricopeptide (TPR) repeat protein
MLARNQELDLIAVPSTLIALKATPSQRKGVDVMSMPLSSMEGYLFSRLDGVMSVEELCAAVSLAHEEVSSILTKLRELGAIDIAEPKEEASAPLAQEKKVATEKKAAGEKKAAAEDEGDLSLEMRRDVMGMRLHVDQANFYQMLGVPPGADRNELRKAYFDLSRKYHPDSYYGKELGRYRPMMEFIFAKLSEGYQVLSRKKSRAEYDEYIADQILAYEMEKSLAGAASAEAPEGAAPSPGGEGPALELFKYATVPVGEQAPPSWAKHARGPDALEAGPGERIAQPQPADAAVATKYQPRFSPEILKQAEALVPRQATEPRLPGPDAVTFPKPQPKERPPAAPKDHEPAAPSEARAPAKPPVEARAPARRPAAPSEPRGPARPPAAPSEPRGPARPPSSLPIAPPRASRPEPQPQAAPTLAAESAAVRRLRQQRGKQAIQALMKGARTIEAVQRPVQPPKRNDPLEEYGVDLVLVRPLPGARSEELLAYQFAGAGLDALRLDDVPTAVSMFERAVELDPDNREVATALEKVRSRAKGSLASSFERQGNYEEQTGKYAQAATSFLKALGYQPEDHRLMVKAAASLLRSEGDLKRARGLARRAVGMRPEKVEYRVSLAEIYVRLGMEPEALEELEVAHRLDPRNERVIRLLRGIERQE